MTVFPHGWWNQPSTVWNQQNWRKNLEQREKARQEQMERITKAAAELQKIRADRGASNPSTAYLNSAYKYAQALRCPTGQTGAIGPTGTTGVEPKELPFSFQTEPIVAFRLWNVSDFQTRIGTEIRLQPVIKGGVHYPPMRKMEAFCVHQQHEAPWANCHCGIWALAEEHLTQAAREYGSHRVWGEVYLWGRVLKASKGYRAQFAYPKQLFTAEPELAEKLRTLYGVPVTVAERLIPGQPSMIDVTALGASARQHVQGLSIATSPSGWTWQTTTTTSPNTTLPFYGTTSGITYGTSEGGGITYQQSSGGTV